MSVAEVARIWQAAGVSCIPIMDNPSKRPALSEWASYQFLAPGAEQVNEWWGNGRQYGLALICGPVSGNLEMTEIEGAALKEPSALMDLIMELDKVGAGGIWDKLTCTTGYAEDSPSGGMHLLYRISDKPVPGNTKIAQMIGDDGHPKTLAETRGHGGYVIVAPTPGLCHPSGEPWRLVNGNYGILPTITWAERELLHAGLKAALDRMPPPSAPLPVVIPAISSLTRSETLSPGDDFEQQTDWADILVDWTLSMRTRDGERHWVRPGKDPRDGMSATTGRANDRDRLYVFSTSTVFENEVPYTKFGAYALLNHGGDHAAAAKALRWKGFGAERPIEVVDALDEFTPTKPAEEDVYYTHDDVGNALRLKSKVDGTFRYIYEEKSFYRWDGAKWSRDTHGAITREMAKLTDAMAAEVAAGDPKEARTLALAKWTKQSRNASRVNAAVKLSIAFGLTYSSTKWAPNRHLVNCANGVLDLDKGELLKHDPKYLMVHTLGAAYDPDATCPQFEQFMEQAVPSVEMRRYVQRALGYSLLGDADQRSIFLIHGPSGTGKSTLIETMREIFGDYGITAGAGAFRASTNQQGPTADLHMLRGRRFVTTSETAEGASFDEDLLKRLSGRDRVSSRTLYQEAVEWTPECTLWIATNNPPKFNSDDDAIWRRTKLIPFTTVFRGEGEVTDYARKMLLPEAAGILNWLLAGLRDFQVAGLQEPQEVQQLAAEQRHDSDSVARFLDDKISDGVLLEGPEYRIGVNALYIQYQNWAHSVGEKTLGNRRFGLRVQSVRGTERTREGTNAFWPGLGQQQASFVGLRDFSD